ncbi:MAG: hypothetical protein BSR46_16545 [Candidatus Dactylopiibacterium carminicum]|nr:AraC family transcriptional regulator [Candidatus Dactylopiibacterium carminicum]PAS95708.1 MAG: hypothetical protein BSR46_16545 [Candidatus Dactylopiibacterium carminicum]
MCSDTADHLSLGPKILRHELLAAGRTTGDYRFLDVRESTGDAVLQGAFVMSELAPGLGIHTAAVTDLCSQRSESEVEVGMKIVMVVEGMTEVSYGHRHLTLGPAGGRCAGAILSMRERAAFSRHWCRGRRERKLVISLSPEWLASNFEGDASSYAERVREFTGQHLAMAEWQPSARAQWMAREVIAPPGLPAGLCRTYQMARSLDIVIEALGVIGSGEALVTAQAHRQMLGRRLCELLQTPAATSLSMGDIARQVGSNPVTLQQIAREALGMTVFEYLREQGLLRARAALAQGQAVAAAATLAGYASQSNFATAFKRRFGITPRGARPIVVG